MFANNDEWMREKKRWTCNPLKLIIWWHSAHTHTPKRPIESVVLDTVLVILEHFPLVIGFNRIRMKHMSSFKRRRKVRGRERERFNLRSVYISTIITYIFICLLLILCVCVDPIFFEYETQRYQWWTISASTMSIIMAIIRFNNEWASKSISKRQWMSVSRWARPDLIQWLNRFVSWSM